MSINYFINTVNNFSNKNQKDKDKFFLFLMNKPDGSTMKISIKEKIPVRDTVGLKLAESDPIPIRLDQLPVI
jgi:hypothetical protein